MGEHSSEFNSEILTGITGVERPIPAKTTDKGKD
jgi:hypothetical protein